MPQFVFSDPVDLTIEDEVTFETEIRLGSIVTVERKGIKQVSIAAIPGEDIQAKPCLKYIVSKGDAPGVIEFSLWKERD